MTKRNRVVLKYRLLNTGVCVAALLLFGWLMNTSDGEGWLNVVVNVCVDLLFYLIVLISIGWLFYVLSPWMRNKTISAALFTLLFVWGCVLYFRSPVKEGEGNYRQVKIERQIEAPNRTVASFFPSRGGFESIAMSDDTGHRLHYFYFQSAVLFYVALLMFSIFGRGIVNRMRKWVTPWRRLNVFWGRSESGLLLARDIINNTIWDQVFFVLQQRSGDGDEWRTLTHDIDRMDAMWTFTYESNAVESDVSKDFLAQAKGRRHFFLDESAYVNVSRADRLVHVLRKWKRQQRRRSKFRCFLSAFRAGAVRWYLAQVIKPHLSEGKSHVLSAFKKWICRPYLGEYSEKPYFYIRIEASADIHTYRIWAANVRDVVTPVLLSEPQLIAKDFVQKYPLLRMSDIKIDTDKAVIAEGEFNILLVGFGSTGQSILNELLCNGQFINAQGEVTPFHVDVVEQDKGVIEEYCIRHPLATRHPVFSAVGTADCYDVKFIGENVRVEGKEFDDWYRNRLIKQKEGRVKRYNRIIVCLNGDDKTLGLAGKIVEFSRRQGVQLSPDTVFARVKDPSRNRYLAPDVETGMIRTIFSSTCENGRRPLITLFGDLSKIYSFERIDADVVDKMAKVLNSRHGDFGGKLESDFGKVEEKWEKESSFNQLSSRAAAEGQRNLLMLLGLDYEKNAHGEVVRLDSDARLDADSSVLRTLAIDEHLRWNAFHIVMGYRPWDILCRTDDARYDIPGYCEPKPGDPPVAIKANQLGAIGKHACIVPFCRLPDVDMRRMEWNTGKARSELNRSDFEGLKPDSSQAWDYVFCQIMGDVADIAGLRIVRPMRM